MDLSRLRSSCHSFTEVSVEMTPCSRVTLPSRTIMYTTIKESYNGERGEGRTSAPDYDTTCIPTIALCKIISYLSLNHVLKSNVFVTHRHIFSPLPPHFTRRITKAFSNPTPTATKVDGMLIIFILGGIEKGKQDLIHIFDLWTAALGPCPCS